MELILSSIASLGTAAAGAGTAAAAAGSVAAPLMVLGGAGPLAVPTFMGTAASAATGAGGLLGALTSGSALSSARTGFENRMARRGYDAGLATDESLKAYERTLQEAAGATFSPDGTQYGGVASRARTVAGWRMPWSGAEKVVVPPAVRADRFDAVVDAIRDDDLKKLGPVTGGQPLTAAQLQASHLVAVANGRYMVAAGDPTGDDPRYVARADGRPYVLDLNALEGVLRTRVPSAYRGGR